MQNSSERLTGVRNSRVAGKGPEGMASMNTETTPILHKAEQVIDGDDYDDEYFQLFTNFG